MTWITKLKRELDTAAVCRRYGITDRTLERRLDNRRLGFPKPQLRGRRRFWFESDLDAFDAGTRLGVSSSDGPRSSGANLEPTSASHQIFTDR